MTHRINTAFRVFVAIRHRLCVILIQLLAFSTFASAEDFTIQTFAGGGLPQNIQGTSAVFHELGGIVTDANGNAYFEAGHTVMRLDSNGVLTLVAGNGTPGFSGDGGLATNAQLNEPLGIAIDGTGNLYIADSGNARIREVQNGVISTIAGGGTQTADNVPAVNALITAIYLATDAAGNIYVEDSSPRIRKISNGVITTIAGNGTPGYSGDGGPAISAQLGQPGAMALDAAGTLYFMDAYVPNPRLMESFCNLRKIQNGVITTVATNVSFNTISVDTAGNIYIADGLFVRKISNGVITTIAGILSPPDGSIGDNGPAIDAFLGEVAALTVDRSGNIFVAAMGLIRKISSGA